MLVFHEWYRSLFRVTARLLVCPETGTTSRQFFVGPKLHLMLLKNSVQLLHKESFASLIGTVVFMDG